MNKRPAIFAVASVLTLATSLCYWPIAGHNFVSLDDHEYIYQNSQVTQGLTWTAIAWAFRTGHAGNWHPLTWISHMVDCDLYRLNPGGHHFTNLLFHIANTVLLLLLLHQMTGALWRSAFVAALFAWHPLHVESVAWASERKDVLSTFFWILTMMAYVRYARESKVQSLVSKAARLETGGRSQYSRSLIWYWITLALFACGLMSKPMLVTLPCVLLLVDFWPLGRLRSGWFARIEDTTAAVTEGADLPGSTAANPSVALAHLVREKLPFFALALASSIATYFVQSAGHAVSSLQAVPFYSRVANAALAYARYLFKSLWPQHLAVFYPYPKYFSIGWVLAIVLLLVAVSAWLVLRAKRHPYLIVAWLWFMGTLVPTLGLVQVGSQSMADRYMYVPSVGLFVLLVWGLNALLDPWPCKRQVLAGVGTAALTCCLACTWLQLGYWQNGEKLFRHAIEVTTDNYLAYDALGTVLNDQGKHDEALAYYSRSVRIEPKDAEGQYDLSTALMQQRRFEEALQSFTAALRCNPSFAQAQINLGKVLLEQGKLLQAAAHFSEAVRLTPDDPEAHYNLGTARLMQAKPEQAVACFSRALRLKPDYRDAHANLGVALMRQGRPVEGVTHLAAALRLNPTHPEAHYNLGLALLELNRPAEASTCFSEALRLNPQAPGPHYHLALALVRQDKVSEALTHARTARDLAAAAGQPALAAKAEELLKQHP